MTTRHPLERPAALWHRLALRGAAVAALALWVGACNSSSKEKSKDDNGGGGGASDTGTGADASSKDNSGDATAADGSADSWENGFYTGFNGKDKFSMYLPSFRPMTVTDPSIAKIESVSVTLSQATIDEVIADKKKDNPDLNEEQLKKMLGHTRNVFKLTPLKAGKTTLKTAGSGRGPSGAWSKGQSTVLEVVAYTPEQVEKGKTRYHADGTGDKKPCASCHETGDNGAPSHALGNVNQIPDKSAKQWITTGKLADRTANIPHAWKFADDDEETGVVAYLRTLQTDDIEQLTKLEIENAAFGMGPPGGGKGGGGAPP
jgi:hypothetical protein